MNFFNKLSHIEKVTYIAQVATSLSFVGACFFSYMSWRETRLTREDQQKFFIDEKRPRLQIDNLHLVKINGADTLIVSIKNTGQTKAEHINLQIGGLSDKNAISKIEYHKDGSYYLYEGIESGVTIEYPLYNLDRIYQDCKCDFDRTSFYLQDAERGVVKGSFLFHFVFQYDGPFGSGWAQHYFVSVEGLRGKDPSSAKPPRNQSK